MDHCQTCRLPAALIAFLDWLCVRCHHCGQCVAIRHGSEVEVIAVWNRAQRDSRRPASARATCSPAESNSPG